MDNRRIRMLVLGVVAVLVAGVVTAIVLWPEPRKAPPAVAAVAQPTPIPPVAESPVAAHPKPKLARVVSAAPTSFRMSGPGFTVDAKVCGMPYVRPLNPPGDQLHTVCWVDQGFGVAPGSPSQGTTYVLGHAWAAQQLVLNPMSEFATAHAASTPKAAKGGVPIFDVPALNGYSVRLDTPRGRLTYRVTTAFLVAKNDAGRMTSVMDSSVRNRVVIITCAVKNGVDLDQNVIAFASLVGAART